MQRCRHVPADFRRSITEQRGRQQHVDDVVIVSSSTWFPSRQAPVPSRKQLHADNRHTNAYGPRMSVCLDIEPQSARCQLEVNFLTSAGCETLRSSSGRA